ncbi:survival motor neuron interacting protein 1-domain-containing protein [Piptocephalis cylindrospora]|uniref:Survival motor neuron interacting protein 1-domain-containing protein n=1 Tax=Piptocephalis cylindrospora TaxID=1907219 RepID=A0A4V1IYE5_9FUNG|nr:survival motor neuron interacting protein 1-domain-containing protein [Piptocephalis cylindrospora]|eukprot:RKP14279.1 survival motor neuron interacting protein 1-domain-containing protein [Piptocephalis cylindrospora]
MSSIRVKRPASPRIPEENDEDERAGKRPRVEPVESSTGTGKPEESRLSDEVSTSGEPETPVEEALHKVNPGRGDSKQARGPGAPCSGPDYLWLVREEARLLPKISHSPYEPSPSSNDTGSTAKAVSIPVPARQQQLRFQPAWAIHNVHVTSVSMSQVPHHPIPESSRDVKAWKAWCYGRDEDEAQRSYGPLLRSILALGQQDVLRLLDYHASQWLQPPSITSRQSIWLYSLLLHLDPVLTSDELYILRKLARKCKEILSIDSGACKAEDVMGCRIILVIVAKCFGQADLLE